MAFFMFSVIVLSMILVCSPFCSRLLLNSSPSSFSSPYNAKNLGFTARLIHRSSPESPFYDPNATPLDITRASSRASLTGAGYFSRLMSNNSSNYSMKYPLSPVDLINVNYVMRYSIGTPPVETFAIPDTGSSLIWLQCRDCINCYNQSLPIFDPRQSSSYQPILCASEACDNTAYTNCNGSQPVCTYNITYQDNSYSIGNIATETLLFKDSFLGHGNYPLFNMLFGCGHDNTDTLPAGGEIPGVVGLSNHSSSLVGQLGFGEFSYCISSNVTSGHSQIRFGLPAIISGRITTALSANKKGLYYFKSVDGIYVDGDKVNIPEWVFQYPEGEFGGLMIDSGTTYSEVYSLALDELIRKLQEKMPSNMEAEDDISEQWDLCYDNEYRDTEVLPEIELRFKDTKEAFPISDKNAWIDNFEGQFCLAIGKSYGVSILGIYQQRDMNVGIDLKQAQVSFLYDLNCPDFS